MSKNLTDKEANDQIRDLQVYSNGLVDFIQDKKGKRQVCNEIYVKIEAEIDRVRIYIEGVQQWQNLSELEKMY